MPTVYVYAPFTGRITGLDNYCNGSPHYPCRNAQPYQVSPVDIATSGSVLKIYLYPSRVSGVYVYIQSRCCCSYASSYGRTIIVDLYSIEGCYVGSVWYGHVDPLPYDDPDKPKEVREGWNPINGPLPLGRTTLGQCCAPCGCSSGCCYTGPHVHMERTGGARLSLYCGQIVSGGQTPIYSIIRHPAMHKGPHRRRRYSDAQDVEYASRAHWDRYMGDRCL
jgi:hypothetical protein